MLAMLSALCTHFACRCDNHHPIFSRCSFYLRWGWDVFFSFQRGMPWTHSVHISSSQDARLFWVIFILSKRLFMSAFCEHLILSRCLFWVILILFKRHAMSAFCEYLILSRCLFVLGCSPFQEAIHERILWISHALKTLVLGYSSPFHEACHERVLWMWTTTWHLFITVPPLEHMSILQELIDWAKYSVSVA